MMRTAFCWFAAASMLLFLAGEPVRARPLGRIERAGRALRRRPLRTALAALLLVALAAGAVVHRQELGRLATNRGEVTFTAFRDPPPQAGSTTQMSLQPKGFRAFAVVPGP